MDKLEFTQEHLLGKVQSVDTKRIIIHVEPENLKRAVVNRLVAIRISAPVGTFLIGSIDRIVKQPKDLQSMDDPESEDYSEQEGSLNFVRITLVGTFTSLVGDTQNLFSRAIRTIPSIDAECHSLEKENLEFFMQCLNVQGSAEQSSLMLGEYALDEKAKAYLNGDRFFQRHAAILGSTGSGKSWTVAKLLEAANSLDRANLVVLDLHGEYHTLEYAKQYRIAGPDDLNNESDEGVLFLPYWLLSGEELVDFFIERSEFSAHNQVTLFRNALLEQKRNSLEGFAETDLLEILTVDTPVPFSMIDLTDRLKAINTERIPGANNYTKQGPNFGKLDHLITRIETKITDRRFGFMFQAPDTWHQYDSLQRLAEKLLGHEEKNQQIKVINFSEVPSEVRPIIVSLVARLIYQVQFWSSADLRHPLAIVCDEAHLYLPSGQLSAGEKRALTNFERIAKEGRKYGVALLVVSQRPADVSETILSQCNNVMALRLTNIHDQNVVKRLMPESLESYMEVLPLLDPGEAVVVGDSVLLPSRIHIQRPTFKPASSTIDFWSEWSKSDTKTDLQKAVENMRRQSRL